MRSAQAFVVVAGATGVGAAVAVGLLKRDTPSCAESCFQSAVNDYACDQWLTDTDCCENTSYLFDIGECLDDNCSADAGSDAWKIITNECYSAYVTIQWDYDILTDFLATRSATDITTYSTSYTTISYTSIETSEEVSATSTPTTSSPEFTTSPILTPSPTQSHTTSFTEDDEEESSSGIDETTTIAIAVPLALFGGLLLLLLLWFALRRTGHVRTKPKVKDIWFAFRKIIGPLTRAKVNEPEEPPATKEEDPPIIYEICGTEVSRTNSNQFLELEASPAMPRFDGDSLMTPRVSRSEAGSSHWNTQPTGEIDLDRTSFAGSSRHQRIDSGSKLCAPFRASNPESVSPMTPSTPPPRPVRMSDPSSSRRPSLVDPPTSPVSDQGSEIDGLLANLAAVEQRRKERASQLQMLQAEEMAIREEEAAILEQLRKRASMIPDGRGSPRSS
uniref:Proline-rich antigen 7 n=1 Tax=Coccidioides posadasii TaxID=199306 RepID=Q1KZG7_COCPO|nr:proline-rich antigen 7 [Coccidioides posadasii]